MYALFAVIPLMPSAGRSGLARVLAQATTSTTEKEVQRVVGDPLSWPVFIGAGVAIFAFIMIGGWLVSRRSRAEADRPR